MNLLDFVTTFASSRATGGVFVELSPFIQAFGWNASIIFRLFWMLGVGLMTFHWWEENPKSCKALLMIVSTLLGCVALFNVTSFIDPNQSNRIFCWQVENWKYMQEILQGQLSISDFQNILDACNIGYTH